MNWIGQPPNELNSIALLIPQFNEGSFENFLDRLKYFQKISEDYAHCLDVIIIDDGSTDESLPILLDFQEKSKPAFSIASVTPNANKVGALMLTSLGVKHEFVILSDFDTDIDGLSLIINKVAFLRANPGYMGAFFRMLPVEGQGRVFEYQQLEYTLARCLYKFHNEGECVPVMPGAGSLYQRDILLEIYKNHSYLRNGEDREATLLGLKFGYKTLYLNQILALTRPPLTFKALVKQRVRWNLGYIETFAKERYYYFTQIIAFKRVGLRALLDISIVLATVLLPIILFILMMFNINLLIWATTLIYLAGIVWSVLLLNVSPIEFTELRGRLIRLILLYPVFKISLDIIAWSKALVAFFLHRREASRNVKAHPNANLRHRQ